MFGELYQQLEADLAKWTGMEQMLVCSSGTAALHLALESLSLPAGSVVILPDYAMIAAARAVIMAGLTPVFVDCGEDLNMDVDMVDVACSDVKSDRVRAILAVHNYGRPCDMEVLAILANKYDLFLIEDLAEAHGIRPHQCTDVACWSFYKNKVVNGEEGGALGYYATGLPLEESPYTIARSLRSMGFTDAHDYTHIPRGHNYRMSNAHARPILVSLRHFTNSMRERRRIEALYNKHCPPRWRLLLRQSPWVYDLQIPDLTAAKQIEIVSRLREMGVAARYGFKPATSQLEFTSCRMFSRHEGRTVAQRLATEVISLPIQPGQLTDDEAREIFYAMTDQLLSNAHSRF